MPRHRNRRRSDSCTEPRVFTLTPNSRTLLGGLTPRQFLRRHWQKEPLLVRGAFPDFRAPLSRSQLFALACRDGVHARLVLERGGDYPWQVLPGPFRPAFLRRLPRRHWSLLVQHVDLLLPQAAALLRRFDFVPRWRIDDLMVSCAPAGGGVGPHLDSYDVFLVQAAGLRRWAINRADYSAADFVPGLDLRLIGRFQAEEEYLVGPGDMLYLPPGVAHHGVALEDDCLTLSIGFRAPGVNEALGRYLDDLPAHMDRRYADPDLACASHAGEIPPAARADIRRLLRGALADDVVIDRWFGCYVSELPEGIAPDAPRRAPAPAAFARRLARSRCVRLATACRSVFANSRAGLCWFVNGRAHDLPRSCTAFVRRITQHGTARVPARPPAALLRALHAEFSAGAVTF